MPLQTKNNYVDNLLLKALREDDEAALSHLFATYYNKLYRTGLKLEVASAAVEEAIQGVFIDLWKYRNTLSDIESFEAYLKTALKRRILKDKKADKNIFVDTNTADLINETEISVASYEEILILQEARSEQKHALKEALDTLSPRQKEVIVMRYFEELSYAEITERTQLTTESVYKIMHEALKRLRVALGK